MKAISRAGGFLLSLVLCAPTLLGQTSPACTIETFAGGPTGPYSGDGGPAVQAETLAWDVAFDAGGNMYIADGRNHRIRIVTLDGIIRTFAGTGVPGGAGDGSAAAAAELNSPYRLTFDTAGICIFSRPLGEFARLRPTRSSRQSPGRGFWASAVTEDLPRPPGLRAWAT